jgi:two-component system sensor histidine kinase CpxA
MRSLFARIFVCTLLIYPLTRGAGMLLMALVGGPPPPPPPSPEVLARLLPLYAETALATLEDDGEAGLGRFLLAQERATGLVLRLLPAGQGGCATPPDGRPPPPGPVAVPAIARDGRTFCLEVRPPRPPHHWHFLPPDLLLPLELGCCALVSFLLARYLARPLRDLHRAALAFADGDLTARGREPPEGRGDEMAALVRAFNRMAERIAALIAAQRRFVADVSHELKSPLARISLSAALARRGAGWEAQAPFERLEREIETASDLVRKLQALSSLEGAAKLHLTDLATPHELLDAAIENVRFEWADQLRAIRVRLPEERMDLLLDFDLLRGAIENVLRNAFFYAPSDTEVTVTALYSGGNVLIEIGDRGPGVPRAALSHLFEPFYRVDEARARNTGGAGVGLAIVASVVALHGGKVWAENASPCGLTIMFLLPLAPATK